MLMLFAFLGSSHAEGPAATPWPTDTPLVYTFSYGVASIRTSELGGNVDSTAPAPTRHTWTCTAKAAKKNGRQEMTCAEPGVGDVWMLWGPGRILLELDVDEANEAAGTDVTQHRLKVLAGALELWPATTLKGTTWDQGGRHYVMRAASNSTSSGYRLTHTIADVSAERVSVTSAGEGTMVLSTNVEQRLEFGIEGEAVFDSARAVLLTRNVRVYPSRIVAGTYGRVGHEVTVTLSE